MKALTRNNGETVRETDGIEGIDWKTGAPLTNPEWCGGPYTLVDNYVEPMDGDGHVPVEIPIEEPAVEEPAVEDDDPVDPPIVGDDYVIIDGVKYKKC